MNILMLSAIIPTPSSLPGSPRAFCFARELSSKHRLSLMLLPYETGGEETIEVLNKSNVFLSIETFPPPLASRPSLLNRLRHFVHNGWYPSRKYLHPEFLAQAQSRVLEICKEQSIDLIYADGLSTNQYVPDAYADRTFMDLCDSQSSFYTNSAKFSKRLLKNLRIQRAISAVRLEEQHAIDRLAVTTVISEIERQSLRSHAPLNKVRVICNGMDADYFEPAITPPEIGHFVFFGVMNFAPNADGAMHFIKDIFPHIRSRYPESRISIVGKSPSAELAAENCTDGVVVTGEVEDVRPWVRRAEAFICPLRIGAGVKNKILASMAMKVPVICSRRSLDGLAAIPGTHILTADTASEYIDAINSLRESPAFRNRLIENAHNLVIEEYSWKSKRTELYEMIELLIPTQEPQAVPG